MKRMLAIVLAGFAMASCNWLILDPQIEKPFDCGEVRRGYVYNYNYTDSVLIDRETICWNTGGGWGTGYRDTPVRDSMPK